MPPNMRNAIPQNNSATGAAGAISASIPAAVNAVSYITGFQVSGAGATAGSIIVVTVTGVKGGPLSYELVVPAGAGVSVQPLQVTFDNPLPASAPNTAITVNVPSFGAGNTNAAVDVEGFQLPNN